MWPIVLSIIVDLNKSLYWVLPFVIVCAVLRKVHITATMTAIMTTVFYHLLTWTAITIKWQYILFEIFTLIVIMVALVRIYRATDYPEAHQHPYADKRTRHANGDFINNHRDHE